MRFVRTIGSFALGAAAVLVTGAVVQQQSQQQGDVQYIVSA